MRPHRVRRDEERLRDLDVARPAGEQRQDLPLAGRQQSVLAVRLRPTGGRNGRADRKGGGGRGGWIWLGSAQLGGAQGKGDGFGLAERAATLAGGIERGRPERVEQPGMVTGAQSFVDGIEGLSSLRRAVATSAPSPVAGRARHRQDQRC